MWKRLHDESKLAPAQEVFWNPKAPEELRLTWVNVARNCFGLARKQEGSFKTPHLERSGLRML